MKVKISTRDAKIGMYVCELDRPWRETPFLFQGFEIRRDEELRALREYCREIYVLQGAPAEQPSPGATAWRKWGRVPGPSAQQLSNLQFEQELLKLNNHPTARSIYQDRTTLEQEIGLAKGVFLDAKKTIDQVLDDVRLGRSLDGTVVRRVVSAMAESVLRNPDALTCYALLKRKHEYTALHGLRSCILVLIFARQLGMGRDQVEVLGTSGLLHDIGMVKVPSEILTKPGPLSPVEMSIMRRHVSWGAEILERSHGMPPAVLDAARQHHERYDGSGYMQGLRGEAISETGLIMGIVDHYDAVTSDRLYQTAISPHMAMRTMYDGRGTLFRTELVERFIQCLGVYPVGSVVQLNTGEVGVVVALNRTTRLKPRVALVRQADQTPYPLPPVVNLTNRRMADDLSCEIERVLDPVEADIDPVRYLPISAAA